MADRALVLTGPTAAGKTALALAVAERLDGEIVSADSRQVYRLLDIGTAKATPAERRRVPHHGIDLVEPDARYSAGRFAREARQWIADVRERGRVPVVVGGTGFFIRALIRPLFDEPPLDPGRREALQAHLESFDGARLMEWLDALDSTSADRLREGGGRQRVLRALEVALLTGRPLGWWHRARPSGEDPIEAITFVLDLPREQLYQRINHRVDRMLGGGLVEEVAGILDRGYPPDAPGLSATGYPEIRAYLSGELTLDQAADRIRARTRGYARRQLTWFRNQLPPDARWLDGTRPTEELVDEVEERWRNR